MFALYPLVGLVLALVTQGEAATPDVHGLGPSAFAAPGVFPTSAFSHYFNHPATATSAQPQPIISDPVTVRCIPIYSKR